MKKSFLALLIAVLSFCSGFFTFKLFNLEKNPEAFPQIEAVTTDEIKKDEVPFLKIEQTNENSETDEFAAFKIQTISAWYDLEEYKNMPEVAMINFYATNVDDDGNNLGKMSYEAGIYTNLTEDVDESYAEGIQVTVENNKFTFKTKKLKGIEYRFQGTFFKGKMIGEKNEKVLRGTLQKFVKGKIVAEASGNFRYFEPYCLH